MCTLYLYFTITVSTVIKGTRTYLINCRLSMCSLREQLCLVGAKKLPALIVRDLMGGAKPERTHRQEVYTEFVRAQVLA